MLLALTKTPPGGSLPFPLQSGRPSSLGREQASASPPRVSALRGLAQAPGRLTFLSPTTECHPSGDLPSRSQSTPNPQILQAPSLHQVLMPS